MRYFKCPWDSCEKAFIRRADLSRHHQIHTNKRPFICPEEDCNKGFHQQSSLKVHQRIHTGEKPYICDFGHCQRAFADPSSYARHQRIHTKEKPYPCPMPSCSQRFSRKSSLRRHQLVLHPESLILEPQPDHALASPSLPPLNTASSYFSIPLSQPSLHDRDSLLYGELSDRFDIDELFSIPDISTAPSCASRS